jgi:phosphoribosylanthranilate isomerase
MALHAEPAGRGSRASENMTYVKICGVKTVLDAQRCVAAGADALGLNFYPDSSRYINLASARAIAATVAGKIALVGVFVDAGESDVAAIRDALQLAFVQFHGDEPPEFVARFLPGAYRAVRVRDKGLREEVLRFPGQHVLLDSYLPGVPGGTGATFDWSLAAPLARERKVFLAGGLHPDNVSEAIRTVRPYAVDVASGVESSPGVKDPLLVERFVARAKQR